MNMWWYLKAAPMDKQAVVCRNLRWFKNSGIMRPSDGFWGVAERILVTADNQALDRIQRTFTCQTRLAPDVRALEHRRPDCNVQTALLFDLAAEALGDPSYKTIADNVIDYLVRRSGLRQTGETVPTADLWGWSNPISSHDCWTDDNAWVATLLLVLGWRGRPGLSEAGIAAGRALNQLLQPVAQHLCHHGKDAPLPEVHMDGLNLSPHWLGLVTMALAHTAAADPDGDYAGFVEAYFTHAASTPPSYPDDVRPATEPTLQRWTLSEYGYLALAGAIVARQFELSVARDAARTAADALVAHQCETGHFPAEYPEAPTGPHLADLIYTQNWATLGLYHAWLLFDRDQKYRRALDQSLAFLERIQDRCGEPWYDGCWRGLYDTRLGTWGGGNRHEGGQGSLYSGWNNAPIALAFLFDLTGESLFARAR